MSEGDEVQLTNDQIILRGSIAETLSAPEFSVIDAKLKELHDDDWSNPWYSVDDLPFTDTQKRIALEWLAWQIQKFLEKARPDCDWWGGKTYDPLFIKDGVAHSYLFDLWDGGRHHSFESLRQIEDGLIHEAVNGVTDSQDVDNQSR